MKIKKITYNLKSIIKKWGLLSKRAPFLFLLSLAFFLLFAFGYYNGRKQRRITLRKSEQVYFYTSEPFFNEDTIRIFENSEGLKIHIQIVEDLDELKEKIIAYQKNSLVLVPHSWILSLEQENLLDEQMMKYKKEVHNLFFREKENTSIPYLWNITKYKNQENQFEIWSISHPKNAVFTEETESLIELLLNPEFVEHQLRHWSYSSTLISIENSSLVIPERKPSYIEKFDLTNLNVDFLRK